MELIVSLKETLTVRPSELSQRQTIELSGLDRISPAILYTIFFYKPQLSVELSPSEEDVVQRAKGGLREVLVSWFPAAGRLRINEGTGKLEIDCNDEGVTMITAATDSKLEDLGRLHEYKPCYEKLVPQLPEADDVSENPLVVVQITRFGCGGISIGFGSSHALFDGRAAFNFLASWAHLSSRSTNDDGDDDHHLLVPNHSRDGFQLDAISYSPTTNNIDSSMSIYEQEHIAGIQDLYGIPMQAMASNDRCWETELARLGRIDPPQLVSLCIGEDIVEAWKFLAVQRGNLTKCSTFDLLSAHIWKARVKALKLQRGTNICLQFPVDCRSRTNPPLGNNFTGNAFVLASVSCLVSDLLQEPLHNTILRIQAAKDVITDEYVKLYVKALESSDKFFPSMRELTIVTDWSRFPFHALDFGWGPVSSAALLATPVPETAFLMLNVEDSDVFLVRMGIGGHHVEDLIANFNDFLYY